MVFQALALPLALAAGVSRDEISLLQMNVETYRAPSFSEFVRHHRRAYREGTDEYALRQNLFERRARAVARHNSQDNRLWTAGINHLSDWTDDEFRGILGWKGSASKGPGHAHHASFLLQSIQSNSDVQEHMWNTSIIGLAADQGGCGSCWAVATAKMLEANHLIHRGSARSFSAQELVNCVPNPESCGGQGGCQGATVELAMAQVMQHGLSTTDDVPYEGEDQKCPSALMQDDSRDGIRGKSIYAGMSLDELVAPGTKRVNWASYPASKDIGLASWTKLAVNKEAPLHAALLEGVVAISVQAASWSSYSHGIFDFCNREIAVIDHAVMAIGFGKEDGIKYWTIRNSWGYGWGESGNIRLLRTTEDHCGEDKQPELGTGCKGGPASVTVCGMCGMYYDSVTASFEQRR